MMEDLMLGRGEIGGPFTLTDHTGARRSLADFRGKVVLLYFGYTYCPDVCPADLAQIAALLRSLGPNAPVQAVYVTVDPERDTPGHLAAYLGAFDPRIVGLTGSVEEVRAVAERYKAYFAKAPAGLMEHSANFYVLDREGRCAGSDKVVALNGNMAAPARATPEEFRRRGLDHVPDEDILAAGVPAAFGALLTALERYGTLPLREAIAPAIELARNGFPASQGLVNQEKYGLRYLSDKFERWPASKTLYMPVPEVGALVKNEALARTYDYLANAKDPHEAFYRGEIAAEIARFSRERGGLLERADLEGFQTRVEAPVSLRFGEATIYKCGFWSQGPAMLQALAIMRRFDLRAMGPGSADYLQLLIEATKLAFADREQYYGDPSKAMVPSEVLLSESYAKARAELIDMRRASDELRPGDAWHNAALLPAEERFTPQPWGPGTVHVDAVDAKGNMASFTPSGAWIRSAEVIGALGFPLSTRMMT